MTAAAIQPVQVEDEACSPPQLLVMGAALSLPQAYELFQELDRVLASLGL